MTINRRCESRGPNAWRLKCARTRWRSSSRPPPPPPVPLTLRVGLGRLGLRRPLDREERGDRPRGPCARIVRSCLRGATARAVASKCRRLCVVCEVQRDGGLRPCDRPGVGRCERLDDLVEPRAALGVLGVVGVDGRAQCCEPRAAAFAFGARAPGDHRDERRWLCCCGSLCRDRVVGS